MNTVESSLRLKRRSWLFSKGDISGVIPRHLAVTTPVGAPPEAMGVHGEFIEAPQRWSHALGPIDIALRKWA
jgi:hypothetical protein